MNTEILKRLDRIADGVETLVGYARQDHFSYWDINGVPAKKETEESSHPDDPESRDHAK